MPKLPAIGTSRICAKCAQHLPLTEFEWRRDNNCYRNECRDCYTLRRYGRHRHEKLYRLHGGMKLKTCSRCRVEMLANAENFSSSKRGSFGLTSRCRQCESRCVMESVKRRDPTFERIRAWKHASRRLHNEYAKRTRANRTPERREAHRRWLRAYEARRRLDGRYRLVAAIRSQLVLILRGHSPKTKGLLRRLGYSRHDLIQHLDAQFQSGMTWDNYGRGGWEVDHIVPVSQFDHSDEQQFQACWALSNLRPMWASENRAKGARVIA